MAFATKMSIGRALVALVLSLAVGCGAGAQIIPQTNPDTEATLHAMTRLAGVIFAGRVISVRRHDGGAGTGGTVEIEFAVGDAIRGVCGSTYTLREWAGLWPAGQEGFRAGQRYLMLLHAPGASGLSSPVDGTDGAIPIRGELGARTDNRSVDLRWIATSVPRTIAYRQIERPTGLPNPEHPYAVVSEAVAAEESGSVAALPATESVSYGAVIATLKRWQKDNDAAR